MNLAGKIAIVTGGAYGIGFATAERLAREGAHVVIGDIKGHEAAADRLTAAGLRVTATMLDVRSDDRVAAVVAETVAAFGTVDILVNNAAIWTEMVPGPFEQGNAADWLRLYDVNVIGVFRMCRAVSAIMRAQKSGRIINLASGTAFKGSPGMLHYVASKGAIISMTRSLATEFGADNVLVNAVSPGFTMTESVEAADHLRSAFGAAALVTRALKREAVATDIANVIYFLASPDSGFVTGQIIAADGGSVFH